MSPLISPKYFIIWLFAFIICFNSACKKPSSQINQKSVPKSIDVFDEYGKKLGRLEENESGNQLFLILMDGEKGPFGDYDDDIKQSVPAHDNKRTAVIYVRNVGATTDYATRLDVVTDSKFVGKLDENTVFIVKGFKPVTVQWKDAHTLLVKYPQSLTADRIYRQKTNLGDINIEYQPVSIAVKESMYVEFANVNYGATGISVKGLSEEILLRKAGWDQEKSGLTKEEWGHWYGSPPYGDDPKEQYYIQQGFIAAQQKNENNNSK
jgi:hypothetical protein